MPDKNDSTAQLFPAVPLVPYTEIHDIKLTHLAATAPDSIPQNIKVDLTFGNLAFRAEAGRLQIKISASVSYSPEAPEEASGESLGEDYSIAEIEMTFAVDLELDDDLDPERIDEDSIQKFVDSNLIFMLYPYVRSTVHRLTGEMPFPVTILPYLRRPF